MSLTSSFWWELRTSKTSRPTPMNDTGTTKTLARKRQNNTTAISNHDSHCSPIVQENTCAEVICLFFFPFLFGLLLAVVIDRFSSRLTPEGTYLHCRGPIGSKANDISSSPSSLFVLSLRTAYKATPLCLREVTATIEKDTETLVTSPRTSSVRPTKRIDVLSASLMDTWNNCNEFVDSCSI